ncbi:MAG: guanylate kinase [Fimbriimonadaceae bacterium]|nr:guanylate kinase [Fimbriimonadaceae bacterium]
MRTRELVIISGPSGVGKDTVIDAWTARNPDVRRVVAWTTRAPRPGESDGVAYHFRSEAEFLQAAADGAFLEHKRVHDNWYGTPRSGVEALIAEGKVPLLKIDVQGAVEVMQARPTTLSIFLLAPSWQELERRIRERGTEDEAAVQRRLAEAQNEIALSERYRFRLVNDDLARTVAQIEAIVGEVRA